MIAFTTALSRHYDNKTPVYVVLRNVTNVGYDGVVVLLSIMIRFKAKRIPFDGDLPQDEDAKEVLLKSGFFTGLNETYSKRRKYKLEGFEGMVTHANKCVNSDLTANILSLAHQTIWGKPGRFQGAQRVLVELMQNTNNHASPLNQGAKHWWLSVRHHPEQKKVTFAFVDYGIGIFRSLGNKQPGDKFFGALDSLIQSISDSFRTNDTLLKKILEGTLHRTASMLHFRGKGLPGTMEALRSSQIAKLHIITNNVRADVANDSFRLLSADFEGTFLSWELNETVAHFSNEE